MPEDFQDGPKNLPESGQPPETRIGKAEEVRERISLLIRDDSTRSQNRSRVKGLVDGNPPYRSSDLVAAGMANKNNVNWRTAEAYLNNAKGAFYDVQNEVPTFATIVTALGKRKKQEHSNIITEEFNWLIRNHDEDFDYETQISQYEMVLYGCGPLMFEDNYSFCTVAVPHRNLLVPEMALSRASKWEECAVLVDYYAHDLYKRIRHDKAATEMGWHVAAVRKALMRANNKTMEGGQHSHWEWHQQQLKNNSFGYSANSKVVQCAHYYVREFPEGSEDCGKITHAIVLINSSEDKPEFLFKKVGRFDNWRQVIHPMYYDNDGGGYHHSVTGMGRKMYSAMDAENKLLCDSYDKAFAPKILFKPNSAAAAEQFKVIKLGQWGSVPAGFDAVQIPIGSFIEEGIVLRRELKGVIASNLSQYRQNMEEKSGNPITAEEMKFRASNISQLGKTQLNHYWNQLDWLYAEKFRRAAMAENKNMPYGKACKEFQQRCVERGVPIEALRQIETVQATRTIGQGSPFMRQQATGQLLSTSQLNPSPAGRMNIYRDYVAANAGQAMVSRYVPEIADAPAQSDQQAIAMLQVHAASGGVPPIVSENQDSRVFAETFMQAMSQSLQGLEQGGNPMEVYQFIETLGPATQRHIQAVAQDPRNKQIATQLQKDWKRIAGMHDKLAARIQQMQQQAAQQQQQRQRAQAMQNGTDPELQLKAAETRAKLGLQSEKQRATLAMKGAKTKQDLAINAAKARQGLAIADATTANDILNERRRTEAEASGGEE